MGWTVHPGVQGVKALVWAALASRRYLCGGSSTVHMTLRALRFRLVNVFAEDSCWSGNALAVIEDARDLSDEEMQAIALQFNLSETTFVLPSATATARVRIFTPSFELPFAGHPTLGTACVVAELRSASDAVTLEMRAGIILVTREGDIWTLCAKPPFFRQASSTHVEIAEMLGLEERDVLGPVLWVDSQTASGERASG